MFVGRDAECARIEQLLQSARVGQSGVLVLRGEAGIGKTALLHHAIGRGGDMRVLRALGVESDAELAFSGLHQLLTPILDLLAEIPEPQALALRGALRLDSSGGLDRFAACAGTLSMLAAAAEGRPLLAVIDDAQWLDSASAQALVFAARRVAVEGIVILFGARVGEERTFDAPGLDVLDVEPLDEPSARELLAPCGPSPEVESRLVAQMSGNPLALLELPRALSREQLTGRVPLPEPLPAPRTIERTFVGRIGQLPEDAKLALLVAAVSDDDTQTSTAAALTELHLDVGALDPADRLGLVSVGAEQIIFRHPLVRAAVYQSASPSDRRAAHKALACALAANGDADRHSWHLAAAATGTDEAIAAVIAAAGVRARERGAPAAASAAFARAAALTPSARERAARRLEAGRAAWETGAGDRAGELLDAALAEADTPLLRADVQAVRAQIELHRGRPSETYELLIDEAARISEHDPERAATLYADAAWAAYHSERWPAVRVAAERAVGIAPTAAGKARIRAIAALGSAQVNEGEVAAGAALIAQAISEIEGNPRSQQELDLISVVAYQAREVREFHDLGRRARALLERAIEEARRRGALGTLAMLVASRGMINVREGRWTHAYADGGEAGRIATEIGDPFGEIHGLGRLAIVEAWQGREENCREHCDRYWQLARGLGVETKDPHMYLGLLELGLGRMPEAIEHLRDIAEDWNSQGHGDTNDVDPRAELVEAYIRAGQLELAHTALTHFAGLVERNDRAWGHARLSAMRGLLCDEREIDAHFAAASDAIARVTMPFDAARIRLAHGERLRRAGRRVDARLQLRAALEQLDELGAHPWAERARLELAASGVTARRRDPSTADQLTPQEASVAVLAAGGSTNREIGAQLFLSPKTIEWHLRSVYRKLGIAARAELPGVLPNASISPAAELVAARNHTPTA